MVGWIKLHRQILDWEWYEDTNTFKVFIHCLLKANHEPKRWQGRIINQGTFVTSIEKLAIETNLSIQKIRTSINKLKVNKEITSTSTNKYTIITICKYEPYQARVIEGQQTGITKPNKQITTTKEVKNKEVINKKEKHIKRKNIPTKEEAKAYSIELRLPINELRKYYNHYESNGWMVGRNKMKDWKAAMRGWKARLIVTTVEPSYIQKHSRLNYGEDNIKSLGSILKEIT